MQYERPFSNTLSPPLPRKRGREQTALAARADHSSAECLAPHAALRCPFHAAFVVLHSTPRFRSHFTRPFSLPIAHSRSRSRGAFLRPGFETLAGPPRNLGGGGARRGVGMLGGHPLGLHVAGRARRLGRLASHDGGGPPLGALTVAILGSGAALPSPAFAPDQSQRAPRARVVVPGSRLSVPPATAAPEPPPLDATHRNALPHRSRTSPRIASILT